MSDFGGLIRDARERLGLSPNRVAELIGRASGTVKAWERGRTVPHDPVVVTSLAAVLAIDEAELYVAAGLNPPGTPPVTTIEQQLASIAPRPTPMVSPDPVRAERPVVTAASSPQEPATEPDTPDDGMNVTAATEAVTAFLHKGMDSLRKLTDRPERAPRQRRVRATATPYPAASFGSYMEDDDERWSYRLRALWTAAGVAALGIVLLWAGARLMAAIGDTLDALLAGL